MRSILLSIQLWKPTSALGTRAAYLYVVYFQSRIVLNSEVTDQLKGSGRLVIIRFNLEEIAVDCGFQ